MNSDPRYEGDKYIIRFLLGTGCRIGEALRGWINYFKIGSMKTLCKELDSNIRYRLRMCIWKHWKTPQNRAKNLMKLDVPRWAAYKIAYCGDRYARLTHNGWVQKAISTKKLTSFGLVSMLDYYTERCVTC
ncbi:MAG TPA: maturase [Lachnospiraceae bacterium]|nr:maturase [Lachnospiraceae bacterium]